MTYSFEFGIVLVSYALFGLLIGIYFLFIKERETGTNADELLKYSEQKTRRHGVFFVLVELSGFWLTPKCCRSTSVWKK